MALMWKSFQRNGWTQEDQQYLYQRRTEKRKYGKVTSLYGKGLLCGRPGGAW